MKILAVDDESAQLKLLQRAVAEACPEAELFSFLKPSEALAFAADNPCDIALLDIQMGGMNGVVLAKRLKDMMPEINVIFCTSYSEYAMEALKLHVSGYLIKPVDAEELLQELKMLRNPVRPAGGKSIYIQTFGNFEVFCDGKPLSFSRSKSKEILAYLVDKQGTSATTAEIAGVIWEDEFFDFSKQRQLQTLLSELTKTLREHHADDIIIKNRKGIMIDRTKVDCDLFRLLDGDAAALNGYMGKYMEAYSWAEFTSAYIERVYS